MTPRKHAELIKGWADGAEIERRVWAHIGIVADWYWIDDPNPTWADDEVYRLKPVPKADFHSYVIAYNADSRPEEFRLRITYDGETGEPKKVEIVK